MRVFAKLRALADFQRRHLPEAASPQEQELVREIGHHQVLGAPMTLKQAMALGLGSEATMQRRIARLKRAGVIRGHRSRTDRRVIELTLSPACMKAFARLDGVLAEAAGGAARSKGRSPHTCSLCASDADGVALLVRFLRSGTGRERRSLLVAPRGVAEKIEAAVSRHEASRGRDMDLVATAGEESAAAMIDYLREVFAEAAAEGKRLRVAVDMAWTLARELSSEDIVAIEQELDRLTKRHDGQVLCQYDVRRFTGARLLEALKCHAQGGSFPLSIA